MDSGCSYHMCPMDELFPEYQPYEGGQVIMGNNASYKVIGIGSIKLRLADGYVKIMSKVRHCLELKRSLISLGALEEEGYSFKVENSILKILKGSRIVMKGERAQSCWCVLKRSIIIRETNAVVNKEVTNTSL